MSRSMRERHVWGNHVEAKRHGCNLCNFKSRKIGSVVEHAKKNHRGVRVTIENLIPLLKPQFEATYARCFPNEIQLQVKKEPEWQRESKEPAEGTTSESPTNKCRICNELLQPATDFVIRNHVWSHASSLPYGCLACGRRMKTLKGLRSHQRSAHKRLAATAKRQYPSKALWAEHRSLMTKCFGSDVGISVESENSKDEDSQSDRESKFESVNMSDSNEETNIDTLSDKIIVSKRSINKYFLILIGLNFFRILCYSFQKKKRRYSRRSKNFPLISYMTRSTAKPIASNGRVLEHPENFLTSTCLPPSSLTDTSSNQSETELHTAVMSRKRKSSSVRRGSYKKAKHPSLNMNNDEPNSDEVHDGEFNAKKEVENPSKRKLRQRQPKVSVESEIRMIIDTENNLTKPRLAKGKIPKL